VLALQCAEHCTRNLRYCRVSYQSQNGFVWGRALITVYGVRPTFGYPRRLVMIMLTVRTGINDFLSWLVGLVADLRY